MEPIKERFTPEELEILAVFPIFIPFDSPDPLPIHGEVWMDTEMEGPVYFAGFYLHYDWVVDVFDVRKGGVAVRGGTIDQNLVRDDDDDSGPVDPPLTSYMILDSGDQVSSFFALLESNTPGLNTAWIKNWRKYIGAVIRDMELSEEEAKMAYRHCGWHLISPGPYFPGTIPIEKTVHREPISQSVYRDALKSSLV